MDGVGLYFTAVLGLVVIYLLLKKPKKQAPQIPGLAPSDPVKGNLSDIGAAGTMHAFQEKHHAKFGGVFSFWYGKKLVVSIAHPDYVRDVNQLDCRPKVLFEYFLDMVGKDSIQFANGAEFERRKKHYVDPAFGYRAVQQYEHEFLSIYTEECFPEWRQSAGRPLDLKKVALDVAVKTITQVAFGRKQGDPKVIEEFVQCYNVTWDYLYSAVKGEPSSIPESEYRSRVETMRRLCNSLAESRKAANISEPFRFIDLLMKESNPELIASEMISFFIGGFHTTGYTIVWTLFFLAKYQKEQERVRAEVDANIPKSQGVVTSAQLTGEKFPLLYNFIEETMRLSRIAPFAARVNEEADVRLHDGQVIPRGTPIIHAIGILSTSQGLWQDANEFFPDRFNNPPDAMTYMPFGGWGKRVCPGKTLLYAEMHTFVANLLRSFTVSFPAGFDPRAEMVSMLITSMKNDPPVVFTSRA